MINFFYKKARTDKTKLVSEEELSKVIYCKIPMGDGLNRLIKERVSLDFPSESNQIITLAGNPENYIFIGGNK